MHLISPKAIREFIRTHPDSGSSLIAWWRIAQNAEWASIQEVREIFPAADAVSVQSGRTVTVFNITGNKYRLLTAIHYNTQRIFILKILKHAEYDRDKWKEQL